MDGLHSGCGRKREIRNDISTFKLKTRRELPGTLMGKDARRASGMCVCVCGCVCRGSGFQSWTFQFGMCVKHTNGDAE